MPNAVQVQCHPLSLIAKPSFSYKFNKRQIRVNQSLTFFIFCSNFRRDLHFQLIFLCFLFAFLQCCRFLADLVDSFGGRRKTEAHNQLKPSVRSLFSEDVKSAASKMEEFDFELLKEELLTQPIDKEGSQLFHRNSTAGLWLRNVSSNWKKLMYIVDCNDHRKDLGRALCGVNKIEFLLTLSWCLF